MEVVGGDAVTIANCTFTDNRTIGPPLTDAGGGGIVVFNAAALITDCTFTDNSASGGASALGVGGGVVLADTPSPTLINCTFTGNTADRGGAVLTQTTSEPQFINCTFIDNSATEIGGVIHNNNGLPALTNCLLAGNNAPLGGAVFNFFGSAPVLTNCTLTGNVADAGGALYSTDTSAPTVVNCIIYANSPDEIVDVDTSLTTVTFSDVQGGFTGTGNIDADPLFVDPDDLRLGPGSPCIDAGYNCVFDAEQCGDCTVPHGTFGCSDSVCDAIVCDADPFCCVSPWGQNCADLAISLCSRLDLSDIITDLDGNPRFVDDPNTIDSGNGDPPVVDMGAYEFQLCPWDCGDNDGSVGISDFLKLLADWGSPGSCDFDGGGIGITDFLALLANWGPCP